MPFWVGFVLIGIGILAMYVEFFVPAFGLIGVGGILAIIATVVVGYRDLPDLQATILLVTAIVVSPTALVLMLRRFPRSYLGRRLILTTQLTSESSPPSRTAESSGSTAAEGVAPDTLTGQRGIAVTPLHPSGTARIGESRFSVVTNGEYLEANTEVVVIQHFGSRIVVRRVPPEGGSHDV